MDQKGGKEITGPGAGSGYDSIVWEYARGIVKARETEEKIPHAHLV